MISAVCPLLLAAWSFLALPHLAEHLKLVFRVLRELNVGLYTQKKPPRWNPGVQWCAYVTQTVHEDAEAIRQRPEGAFPLLRSLQAEIAGGCLDQQKFWAQLWDSQCFSPFCCLMATLGSHSTRCSLLWISNVSWNTSSELTPLKSCFLFVCVNLDISVWDALRVFG